MLSLFGMERFTDSSYCQAGYCCYIVQKYAVPSYVDNYCTGSYKLLRSIMSLLSLVYISRRFSVWLGPTGVFLWYIFFKLLGKACDKPFTYDIITIYLYIRSWNYCISPECLIYQYHQYDPLLTPTKMRFGYSVNNWPHHTHERMPLIGYRNVAVNAL